MGKVLLHGVHELEQDTPSLGVKLVGHSLELDPHLFERQHDRRNEVGDVGLFGQGGPVVADVVSHEDRRAVELLNPDPFRSSCRPGIRQRLPES